MAKKIFFSLMSLILAGVVIFIGCFFGIDNFNAWVKAKFKAGIATETPNTDNNDGNSNEEPVDGGFVNSGENKGIFLMSRRLASAEFEDYGIDLQANTAYSITATVNEDAEDKSVIGSVSWKNSSSSWATGKMISDYVSLNQTEQYGLNFTLTVKQAFGEPVIVKVASCMDSGVYGTAQVDYLKELKSFTATINPSLGNDVGRIYIDRINTIEITPNYGVGTLVGTISNYKTTLTTNNYFRTELKKKLNAGNGTSSFTPSEKLVINGKDFMINNQVTIPGSSTTYLWTGGGNTGGAITITNNFIKQSGCTNSVGTMTALAGVVEIDYEIKYSYGSDYSVTVTYRDVAESERFHDNPTTTIYGFRNDNLTTISTISNIQVAPDAIIVYPN